VQIEENIFGNEVLSCAKKSFSPYLCHYLCGLPTEQNAFLVNGWKKISPICLKVYFQQHKTFKI
jgi:hypothetical protein